MKIAVVGIVYVSIKIDIESKFDVFGNNRGYAVTEYSSPSLELAKKLVEEGNEVSFISSLDTPASMYIKKSLDKLGISTYVPYEAGGLGFKVEFAHNNLSTILASSAFSAKVDEVIDQHEDSIFNELDVLIIDHIDSHIAKLCNKHNTKLFWLADQDDLQLFDSEDMDMKFFKDVPVISENNYSEVIK